MQDVQLKVDGHWNCQGELELMLPDNAPEHSVIRYCFPWDGKNLLYIQGQYLAPIACDPGTTVRARIFLGRHGISETQAFTKPGTLVGNPTPRILVQRTQNRDFRAYDWGDRHSEVCRAVREGSPGLLMLGDSITHFWGGIPNELDPLGYMRIAPDIWEETLGSYRPVNLGFGNDRIENALWRVEHGELDGASSQALCVILLGTNNLPDSSPEEIALGLESLCQAVRNRLPHGSILVQGIYPRKDTKSDWTTKRLKANELIQQRIDRCGIPNVFYADIGSVLESQTGVLNPLLTRDGLHPSRRGYEAIASQLGRTLKSIIK